MDCIFCKIISGDIPAYKIYEDDIVLAMLDVNPKADGHILIIPKIHYENLINIPDEVLTHINNISKKMYTLLVNELDIRGASILNNIGDAQEIKHFHMHIVPINTENELKKVEEIYKILKKNK